MIDNKLVIGFIGNGKSTNRYNMPFVLKRPDKVVCKTIYARDLSKTEWDRIPGVKYTDDLHCLLHDPEIDLIMVSTGHDTHYKFTKIVLEAGKHCMCEKPFMETAEQARELFALAKEKGLFLQAFQNRRFDSDFLTVQRVIESGKLGEIIEVEMGFDYYRPEIPNMIKEYRPEWSYLYGHGCHTIDQVLSYWGKPKRIVYDVRQLLGTGRMNDYFDLDMFYDNGLKVSVKSSYFRIKPRPSFIVYGKNGMFVKETKDRQEEHLKLFHMPTNKDFGLDEPGHYGTITYVDNQGQYHEEKVISEIGDYAMIYDHLYDSIVLGKEKLIKDEDTILQLEILEAGVKDLK